MTIVKNNNFKVCISSVVSFKWDCPTKILKILLTDPHRRKISNFESFL